MVAKSNKIWKYSDPIKVEVDFPCEFDQYWINPVRHESESPLYFRTDKNLTRLLFKASANSMTRFDIDISHRFLKLSPEGYCTITKYIIQKVMIDQTLIDPVEYSSLFEVSKTGIFSVMKFDTAFADYLIMVSPCNRLICGNLG